jgi:hypothetical protein
MEKTKENTSSLGRKNRNLFPHTPHRNRLWFIIVFFFIIAINAIVIASRRSRRRQ